MLDARTRRDLKEHKFLNLKNNVSNPSQKLKRLANSSIAGIEDLALIGGETPEALQDQVFTSKKFELLIEKILKLESSLSKIPSVNRTDARRAQLGAMLVNKGIKFLKLQYEFLEHDSPGLADIVLGQLSHAARISNEIANKVELLNIRNVASKTKLEYLFNWKKVNEKDEKLWSYLYGEIGEYFGIENIERSPDDRKLKFDLISEYEVLIASIMVSLSSKEDKATLLISKGSTKIEREFVVRWENDELYVFKKINDS